MESALREEFVSVEAVRAREWASGSKWFGGAICALAAITNDHNFAYVAGLFVVGSAFAYGAVYGITYLLLLYAPALVDEFVQRNETEGGAVLADEPPADNASNSEVTPDPVIHLALDDYVRDGKLYVPTSSTGTRIFDINDNLYVLLEQVAIAREKGLLNTVSVNALDTLPGDLKISRHDSDNSAQRVMDFMEGAGLVEGQGERQPYRWTSAGRTIFPCPINNESDE